MITFVALGSASLMFLIGSAGLIYVLVIFFVMKREVPKKAIKSTLFCFAWSLGLLFSWYVFVFVL